MNTQEKKELVAEFKKVLNELNSKIENIEKNGIEIKLIENSACMSSGKPRIEADVFERVFL